MNETQGDLRTRVNGKVVRVADATHLRCPACHGIALRSDDLRRLEETAIGIYRKRAGLLSADEIRALRDQLGLTQVDLAHLLGLGPNTLSRWESGQYAQQAALDLLLRMIRDLPGSVQYLRDARRKKSRSETFSGRAPDAAR